MSFFFNVTGTFCQQKLCTRGVSAKRCEKLRERKSDTTRLLSSAIDSATKLATRIHATLITIGSLGTAGTAIFVAATTDLEWAFDKIGLKQEWQWLLKKLGVEKDKDGTEEEKAVAPES